MIHSAHIQKCLVSRISCHILNEIEPRKDDLMEWDELIQNIKNQFDNSQEQLFSSASQTQNSVSSSSGCPEVDGSSTQSLVINEESLQLKLDHQLQQFNSISCDSNPVHIHTEMEIDHDLHKSDVFDNSSQVVIVNRAALHSDIHQERESITPEHLSKTNIPLTSQLSRVSDTTMENSIDGVIIPDVLSKALDIDNNYANNSSSPSTTNKNSPSSSSKSKSESPLESSIESPSILSNPNKKQPVSAGGISPIVFNTTYSSQDVCHANIDISLSDTDQKHTKTCNNTNGNNFLDSSQVSLDINTSQSYMEESLPSQLRPVMTSTPYENDDNALGDISTESSPFLKSLDCNVTSSFPISSISQESMSLPPSAEEVVLDSQGSQFEMEPQSLQ